MRTTLICLAALACTAIVGGLVGCGDSAPPPSKKTQEQSSRLQDIRQKTGGDWGKLTPEDKDYLVNQIAHGSEMNAKMMLMGNKMMGNPPTPGGGPPRPGGVGNGAPPNPNAQPGG